MSVQNRKVLERILVKGNFKTGDWGGEETYQERPTEVVLCLIPIFFSD